MHHLLLRFQGHLNSNPDRRGKKKKKGRSGDRRAIGAPLGTKEIYLWVLLAPALECLVPLNLNFWKGVMGGWVGGQVASRFEGNWGPTEFKEGNLIKSANSSRRRVRWSLEVG